MERTSGMEHPVGGVLRASRVAPAGLKTYARRPEIPWPPQNEAVRVTDENLEQVAAWVGGKVVYGRISFPPAYGLGAAPTMALVGEWVIAREDGAFFVRDDEWFQEHYVVGFTRAVIEVTE